MNHRLLFTLLAVILGTCFSFAGVRIIFDTDHGGDADDLGALVMLHNFHNRGECELLAVMSWSTEEYVIPAMDAINRWYGNPGIPMGVRSHGTHYTDWNYNKPIADALPWELSNSDVPLAVDLYRKILSEHENNSITIVTVGPLKNIQDLLMSGPDQFSDLNGKELIEEKVKKFVIMGGRFPHGEWEWNFSRHASWMKDRYREGRITPNASYDQTAVLYAVRGGVGRYWDLVENGYCEADDTGGNIWVESDEPANHSYLVLKISPEEMVRILYSVKLGEF